VENSREGYHPEVVHKPTYNRLLPDRSSSGEWLKTGGHPVPGRPYRTWDMISGTNDDGLWMPRAGRFASIDGLSDYDRANTHFLIAYPMFLLNLAPAIMGLHQLFPISPSETLNITWICFPKGTAARPDFEEQARIYYELPDAILPEDKEACELTQRGLESRLAQAGRYDVEETPCYLLHHFLLDRVLGPGWHQQAAGARS
jgi:phenylpropionate dioxygenase-like ring-hydroxylating dioxygenase large terminal subunit